jgi:hypothetical protein
MNDGCPSGGAEGRHSLAQRHFGPVCRSGRWHSREGPGLPEKAMTTAGGRRACRRGSRRSACGRARRSPARQTRRTRDARPWQCCSRRLSGAGTTPTATTGLGAPFEDAARHRGSARPYGSCPPEKRHGGDPPTVPDTARGGTDHRGHTRHVGAGGRLAWTDPRPNPTGMARRMKRASRRARFHRRLLPLPRCAFSARSVLPRSGAAPPEGHGTGRPARSHGPAARWPRHRHRPRVWQPL